MDIVIIGAGIGGLVAALSLHDAGFDSITVIERVPEVKPLGVGINLLPHAVRELTELGLSDELARIGVPTAALTYYNRHGQPIWSEPRGRAAGYAWPQYSVHRGRFQMLLLDAVRARLGDGSVRLGLSAQKVDDEGEKSVVRYLDGSDTPGKMSADLVIAADGIHSALRRQHYPAEGRPVWNGLTLWRGTTIARPFLDGRTMIMAGDGEQKFVAYPLTSSEDGSGPLRINFIAERRAPEGGEEVADWNNAVDAGPIAELFSQWRFDWLDIPELIGSAEQILEYPMVDRDPIPTWTFGRATLLGDAAHAMYPNGSNGSSQAILDARTLAYTLATNGSVPDALAAYESERRPLTTALTALTRQTGPERVMQLAYERAPEGFADVHDVIPRSELESIAAEYKRAAGFDPAQLNARSSLTASPVGPQ